MISRERRSECKRIFILIAAVYDLKFNRM